MVNAFCFKLKDHLWYLSEPLVPTTLFSVKVTDRDKKEMANAILKHKNQAHPDCQQTPETEDFGAKLLKHFVGPDLGICFEMLHWEGTGILYEER